jgi:hypothetical protein
VRVSTHLLHHSNSYNHFAKPTQNHPIDTTFSTTIDLSMSLIQLVSTSTVTLSWEVVQKLKEFGPKESRLEEGKNGHNSHAL